MNQDVRNRMEISETRKKTKLNKTTTEKTVTFMR